MVKHGANHLHEPAKLSHRQPMLEGKEPLFSTKKCLEASKRLERQESQRYVQTCLTFRQGSVQSGHKNGMMDVANSM